MRIPRWLPNAISLVRVAMVPGWIWLAERTRSEPELRLTLGGLLLALGLSDVLDGWLARRFEATTRFGATLDALADKLAQLAFVSYLTWLPHPPLQPLAPWFFAVVAGHNVLMGIGYLVVRWRHGRVDTEHAVHGKIASVLLFLLVLSAVTVTAPLVTEVLSAITAPVVIVSTVDYLRRGWTALHPNAEARDDAAD